METSLKFYQTGAKLPVNFVGSLNSNRASGAGIDAGTATGAFVSVDDGNVFNFNSSTGAGFGAGTAGNTRIFINDSGHFILLISILVY